MRFVVVAIFSTWVLTQSAWGEPPVKKIQVVATTGMVGDLVSRVGGDLVEVQTLMGPGVDPHLYKARPSDILKLLSAKVVFYSGLHLEGRMQDLLEKLARRRPVFAVTSMVDKRRLLTNPAFGEHPDPHAWFDVALWSEGLRVVEKALGQMDPGSARIFHERAVRARVDLIALDQWVRDQVKVIPKDRRVLVTSHDAFNYFGRAYGVEVVGVQGLSTVSEAGLSDVVKMVEWLKNRKVPAIFVESSVSHAVVESIAKAAKIKIGGELFSDAMGTRGELERGVDLGSYEGMIRHNVWTLQQGLLPQQKLAPRAQNLQGQAR